MILSMLSTLYAMNLHAELVDRFLAAVNNDVITYSDLMQAMAFNEAVSGPLRDREKAAAETLEGLINRRLLLQEANRFGFPRPDKEEVLAELEAVKKRIGDAGAFSRFLSRSGMSEEQLMSILADRLYVERFLERRISVFVRVGRREAEAYYKAHPDEFSGKQFSEVYRSIIADLTLRKKEKQISKYISELRERAVIHMLDVRGL